MSQIETQVQFQGTLLNLIGEPAEDPRCRIAPGSRRAYILAGRSKFTIRSPKTSARYTFKVSLAKPREGMPDRWWVSVLTGSDNKTSYTYAGSLTADGSFRLGSDATLRLTSPSVAAFVWLARNWEHPYLEVWHESVCGRCGDTLTVPESIERGYGPKCYGYIGKEKI